jgi:two-component system CheB/CheR fusion protein
MMLDEQAGAAAPGSGRMLGSVPIIGVGASAGGLEAFQDLVTSLNPGHELALVLVQHLDPNHESLLPELLAKKAKVPIVTIRDGMKVEPRSIYLIPPNASLTIAEGTLKLASFDTPRGQRRPIDLFFESLAEDQGSNCACIILSGTGSDGSIGVKAVKQAGGLVFVQDPKLAKYDGMPNSAIATSAVDLVLPTRDMVAVIDEYFNRRVGIEPSIENDREFIARVAKHVRYRTGHDFSHYKQATLLRRLARRMSVLGVNTPGEYLQRLISDGREAQQLFRDLLINVTSFFRDVEAFSVLRAEAIAKLITGKGPHEEVRIWVPGCSTGQEAYSIAIIAAEELSRTDARPKVSIFATDIDEEALHIARQAIYPNSIAEEISEDRIERYFTNTPQGFRVGPGIRDMVRVSTHSLIKDPPFSNLDLVSCRNLLIYFDEDLQSQVFPVFHYALKPDGYLLLGHSEHLGKHADLFQELNSPHRLFRRKPGPAKPVGRTMAPLGHSFEFADILSEPPPQVEAFDQRAITDAILARHSPAHVVINNAREVIYASGRTGRFLELSQGGIRLNIVDLAKPELRTTVRGLLASLTLPEGRIRTREFQGEIDGNRIAVAVTAERLDEGSILIVFQDRLDFRRTDDNRPFLRETDEDPDNDYVRDLEEQLDSARQTIRTTVEELETSNEELKSSNEEMMSMNEELQSANEELSTINEELQNKVGELAQVNGDLRNLIDSTELATIFLDTDLRVRNFTPEARRYFRLVEHDSGRLFKDIKTDIEGHTLFECCERVLANRRSEQAELQTIDGVAELLARVVPYRTDAGQVGGIVMTFTPVTELRRAARRLKAAEAMATQRLSEIEELYRVAPQAMAMVDRDLKYVRVNQRLADMNGHPVEHHLGRSIPEILPKAAYKVVPCVRQVFETGESILGMEMIGETDAEPDVARRWEVDWYPLYRDDEIHAVGLNVRDVTKYKELELELRRVMRELQHRVKNMLGNVMALINRARRADGDPRAVLDTLSMRIRALANTHNLLTAQNWGPTRFADILKMELVDVYGAERVQLRGPELRLNTRATLALGMAFHELATNASKYGACSTEHGKVKVQWSRYDEGDGEKLLIRWVEEGGPSVVEPAEHGFGSRLIESTIKGSLGGALGMQWERSGLNCVIEIPFERATTINEDELTGPIEL